MTLPLADSTAFFNYVHPAWGDKLKESDRLKLVRAEVESHDISQVDVKLLVETTEKLRKKALGTRDLADTVAKAIFYRCKEEAFGLSKAELKAALAFYKVHSGDIETIKNLDGLESLKVAFFVANPKALEHEFLSKEEIARLTLPDLFQLANLATKSPESQKYMKRIYESIAPDMRDALLQKRLREVPRTRGFLSKPLESYLTRYEQQLLSKNQRIELIEKLIVTREKDLTSFIKNLLAHDFSSTLETLRIATNSFYHLKSWKERVIPLFYAYRNHPQIVSESMRTDVLVDLCKKAAQNDRSSTDWKQTYPILERITMPHDQKVVKEYLSSIKDYSAFLKAIVHQLPRSTNERVLQIMNEAREKKVPLDESVLKLLQEAQICGGQPEVFHYLQTVAYPYVEPRALERVFKQIDWGDAQSIALLPNLVARSYDDQLEAKLVSITNARQLRLEDHLSKEEIRSLTPEQAKGVIDHVAHKRLGLPAILTLYQGLSPEVKAHIPRVLVEALVERIGSGNVEKKGTQIANLNAALRQILQNSYEDRLVPLLENALHPEQNIYQFLPHLLPPAWGKNLYLEFMEKMPIGPPQVANQLDALYTLFLDGKLKKPQKMQQRVFDYLANHDIDSPLIQAKWLFTALESKNKEIQKQLNGLLGEGDNRHQKLFFIFSRVPEASEGLKKHLDTVSDMADYLKAIKPLLVKAKGDIISQLLQVITSRATPLTMEVALLLSLATDQEKAAYLHRLYPSLLETEINEAIRQADWTRHAVLPQAFRGFVAKTLARYANDPLAHLSKDEQETLTRRTSL